MNTPETRKKLSITMTGRHPSPETIKKMAEYSKKFGNFQDGCKNWNWRGGIMSENTKLRKSNRYLKWKIKVFKQNNFTCQKCGDNKGGNLTAHHIKNFSKHIKLRFITKNGITLCNSCHRKFHLKYGTRINNQGQIDEFLKDNISL